MKTPKEILEECLSYYNVEGLVQEGSRLWMAIIDAMRTFAKDEPEQKPSRQDRAWDDLGNTLYEIGHAETPNEID